MDEQPKVKSAPELALKAALEKAKSKSLPDYAIHRWHRQELKSLLKRKHKKNPFVMPTPNPRHYESLKCLGSGAAGAIVATLVDKYLTHQVPSKWHLPMHGAVTGIALLAPWAGFGGAAFYGLLSEGYYRLISQGILAKAKKDTTG